MEQIKLIDIYQKAIDEVMTHRYAHWPEHAGAEAKIAMMKVMLMDKEGHLLPIALECMRRAVEHALRAAAVDAEVEEYKDGVGARSWVTLTHQDKVRVSKRSILEVEKLFV